jgi:hypothetical protein
MKRWSGVVFYAAFLCVLGLGLPVGATGEHGTQGPRFLGWGLDSPSELAPGFWLPKPVQTYHLVSTFPPHKDTDVKVNGTPVFTLTNLSCQLTLNRLLARCQANVTSVSGLPGPICNTLDGTGVKLVAINAGFDTAKWALDFGQSNTVVFACEDPSAGKPDPMDRIGAIGKCIEAGFFLYPTSHTELDACIRASRADYCGDGNSYTRPGTHFAVYDSAGSDVAAICWPGECFEASWDENGAVCINHLRYANLRALANVLGPGPFDQKGKRVEQSGGASRNICPEADRGKPPKEICLPRPDNPLTKCLDAFVDFYYDDQHRLDYLDPAAVNLITAQYACRTKRIRTNEFGLFTRTMVRINMNGGAVDQLPCCDTLGCP